MIKDIGRVVQEIGELLNFWSSKKMYDGIWKGSQFKAKVDLLAHHALVEKIRKLDNNNPIISEEDTESLIEERPNLYWLIDPLDGTASFINGFPGFVTQIALIENNFPIMSAVYAPSYNQLYTAEKNKGAFLNGHKLMINHNKNLTTIIDNYPTPKGITENFFSDFKLKTYKESGSISLKICRVADGMADLFIKDVIIKDWDIAAPHLILKEAGGFLTDINGEKFNYLDSYENKGLICSYKKDIIDQVVKWYKS